MLAELSFDSMQHKSANCSKFRSSQIPSLWMTENTNEKNEKAIKCVQVGKKLCWPHNLTSIVASHFFHCLHGHKGAATCKAARAIENNNIILCKNKPICTTKKHWFSNPVKKIRLHGSCEWSIIWYNNNKFTHEEGSANHRAQFGAG